MNDYVCLEFMLHDEPCQIVKPIPNYIENEKEFLQTFTRQLALQYFQETLTVYTPDEMIELRIAIAKVVYHVIHWAPPTPTPTPRKPEDPELKSAFELAQESLQIAKETKERVERHKQKVQEHYKKYGSAIPNL